MTLRDAYLSSSLYTDAELIRLTTDTAPLRQGDRHYDVLVTDRNSAGAWYTVAAPNKVTAKKIAREYAARIEQDVYFSGHPVVTVIHRSDQE